MTLVLIVADHTSIQTNWPAFTVGSLCKAWADALMKADMKPNLTPCFLKNASLCFFLISETLLRQINKSLIIGYLYWYLYWVLVLPHGNWKYLPTSSTSSLHRKVNMVGQIMPYLGKNFCLVYVWNHAWYPLKVCKATQSAKEESPLAQNTQSVS